MLKWDSEQDPTSSLIPEGLMVSGILNIFLGGISINFDGYGFLVAITIVVTGTVLALAGVALLKLQKERWF